MKLKISLLSAAALFGFVAAPVSAQGVPVIDPGNIAQTVKVVQNGMQQLQSLQQQFQQMQAMGRTLGKDGLMSIASDVLKTAGIDFSDLTKSPIAQYRSAMPGILDALPNSQFISSLGLDSGQAKTLAEGAKGDINKGRQFALNVFYKAGNATITDMAARQGVRDAAMRDSVTSGYAMAVYAKNDLANNETQMKALSEGVSKSQDLRSDVQANSAIEIAQLQQLTVQNQLLAQLLEVQSTSSMAGTGMGAGSSGSSSGGTGQ